MKIIPLLLLLTFVHGCGDKKKADAKLPSDISVTAEWETPPVSNTTNNSVILTFNPKGQTIEVTDFDPQMPSHGHGTAKENQKLTPLNDADLRTRVSGVFFTMPGPWVIGVSVKVDGVLKTTSFDVEVH